MTVAELIEHLRQLPQDLKVCINDEEGGVWHEEIDFVQHFVPDEPNVYEDEECVVLVVNEVV